MTENETLVRFLVGAAPLIGGAPRPDNAQDAEHVLASVHQLMDTTDALHDEVAGCFGAIDNTGRCVDCGRLVAPGMWRAHKEGPGCLMAVPFVGTAMWLAAHREGIPVVGNLIWRYRNRRSATTPEGTAASSGDGSPGTDPASDEGAGR